MGGPGSGRKADPSVSKAQRDAIARVRARERYHRVRGSDAEIQRRVRAREERKAWRKTAQGKAEWRRDVRVARWWEHLRRQLRRSSSVRGIPVSIDCEWIRAQFDRQQGRCFYTGIPFEIVETNRGIRRPSLDRKDSRLGYTPENTVLCLTAINYMKNDYDLDEFMALLLDIREA